jgi:hypothetical protein
MSKTENIKARLPDGALRDFPVKVSEYEPWTIEFHGLDGSIRCCQATDLFNALQEMRKDLESAGCQLLCAGARPDVTPSGMSRSMGGGRKAYIVHLGSPASRTEMVDIFDYAEPAVVGTVQQQRDYIRAWYESLRQRQ